MDYIFIVLAFVISVFVARLIIPRILIISLRKKLFDIPDARKIHKRAIPRLGGVSFFPTILFSCCLVLAFRSLTGYNISDLQVSYVLPECLFLICGMTLLYLTGIADDLIGVRYRQKFVVQILCACFLPISGLWINDLYGLFGVHVISAWVGIPFTVLTIVFITNAVNLIDGIDGLASGLSSVALLVFGVLFIEQGFWMYSIIAFSTFGVLVPFFYYNVFGSVERARKIFMGDTGSLSLGGIIAVFAIMIHKELLIPILCGIFLVENLSVAMQVSYFKYTKRKFGEGRRIFLMSPLHHHFQKKGIPEPKIVTRFWIVGIALAVITIVTLKIR